MRDLRLWTLAWYDNDVGSKWSSSSAHDRPLLAAITWSLDSTGNHILRELCNSFIIYGTHGSLEWIADLYVWVFIFWVFSSQCVYDLRFAIRFLDSGLSAARAISWCGMAWHVARSKWSSSSAHDPLGQVIMLLPSYTVRLYIISTRYICLYRSRLMYVQQRWCRFLM
jgi:hypothetical protein